MKKSLDKTVLILLIVLGCVTIITFFIVLFAITSKNTPSQEITTTTTAVSKVMLDGEIASDAMKDDEEIQKSPDSDEESTTKKTVEIIDPTFPTERYSETTKKLTGWKQAYYSYLFEYIYSYNNPDEWRCFLMYVNNDNIPELYICGPSTADGCKIVTYSNNSIYPIDVSYCTPTFIRKGNKLCLSGGHMGYYFDHIYSVKNGEFVLIESGKYVTPYTHIQYDEFGNPILEYYWNDEPVTMERYYQYKENAISSDKSTTPEEYELLGINEFLSQLN